MFGESQCEALRAADETQCLAHLATGVACVVRPEGAKGVEPSRFLPISARFVRTGESNDGAPSNAKSRLWVRGHSEPKEEVLADALAAPPPAPPSGLFAPDLLFSLAAARSWSASTFDVVDAGLSGKANSQNLYVRPPREGIKGVPQDALVELAKGCSG